MQPGHTGPGSEFLRTKVGTGKVRSPKFVLFVFRTQLHFAAWHFL